MARKYKSKKQMSIFIVCSLLALFASGVYTYRSDLELEVADLAYNAKGNTEKIISRSDANFWYELSADNGNTDAMVKYGNILISSGSTQSINKGVLLIKKAADLGDQEAQYKYGKMLSTGKNTQKDLLNGAKYLELSLKNKEIPKNHKDVYSLIASNYYGLSLNDSNNQSAELSNLKSAISWAEQGVAHNEILSCEILTDIYLSNKLGLSQTDALKKASEFNAKAIELGSHTNGLMVLINLKLYEITQDKMYADLYNKHFPLAYTDPQDKNRTMLENAPILKGSVAEQMTTKK